MERVNVWKSQTGGGASERIVMEVVQQIINTAFKH